ncbi:MAG: DUF4397 domain-containing protein [Ginsengibacter sp.]
MKNKFISSWQSRLLYLFAFSTFLITSCKKTSTTDNISTQSGLMAFNLIPDSTFSIAFAFSGASVTNAPLPYTNYTGSYFPITSGNQQLSLYKANPDSLIMNISLVFEPSKYYSAFAIGANGNYKQIVTNDEVDSLPTNTGNAFIRYVNAIPDSSKPAVTIALNGNNVVNTTTSFSDISNFTGVAPGSINVTLDNGSTISVNKTISVAANGVYTILLVGIPGATDTTREVKITSIQNGTLTP